MRFIEVRGKNATKTVMYAPNEAAQLIAERNRLSIRIHNKYLDKDSLIYFVETTVIFPNGRTVDNVGATHLGTTTGTDRANAIMKAVTKAQRRAIFSACGLSVWDEDDVDFYTKQKSSYGATSDGPNLSPAGVLQLVQPEDVSQEVPETTKEDEERQEYFEELLAALTGKNAPFYNRPVDFRNWISDNSDKLIQDMSAQDLQDLMVKVKHQFYPEHVEEEELTEEAAEAMMFGDGQQLDLLEAK